MELSEKLFEQIYESCQKDDDKKLTETYNRLLVNLVKAEESLNKFCEENNITNIVSKDE